MIAKKMKANLEVYDVVDLKEIRAYLAETPAGAIGSDRTSEVERLLAECWDAVKVTSQDEGLEPYKLRNRTEGLTWNPPLLKFQIERHGGTAMGSVYAEVHSWKVNLETGEASLTGERRRLVRERDAPLNVKALADQLAKAILKGKRHPHLKWDGNSRVRVLIAEVIPATNRETTSGRRKRFWKALEEQVLTHGWRRASAKSQFLTAVPSA